MTRLKNIYYYTLRIYSFRIPYSIPYSIAAAAQSRFSLHYFLYTYRMNSDESFGQKVIGIVHRLALSISRKNIDCCRKYTCTACKTYLAAFLGTAFCHNKLQSTLFDAFDGLKWLEGHKINLKPVYIN
jgi:hypothetical protein